MAVDTKDGKRRKAFAIYYEHLRGRQGIAITVAYDETTAIKKLMGELGYSDMKGDEHLNPQISYIEVEEVKEGDWYIAEGEIKEWW